MSQLLRRSLFTFAKLVKIDYDNLKDKVLALDPKIRFYGQVTMLRTRKFEVEIYKDDKPPTLLYSGLSSGRITRDRIQQLAKKIHQY